MKYSVVIPTYNHCDDLLKPAVQSIFKYTNLADIELIISANGCTDNTKEYLNQLKFFYDNINLPNNFKYIWNDEPLGYPKSVNEGIKISSCEKIVLLNNDIELLDQTKNCWLEMLNDPFLRNDKMGAVGPLMVTIKNLKKDVLFFFCVMISRKVINEIGLLDEDFSPGYCEDSDYCLRILNAGYEIVQAGFKEIDFHRGSIGTFPIYHKTTQTFKEYHEKNLYYDILNRNNIKLYKKHLKDAKLNIGCGSSIYDDYLNIDLYDDRADLKMDIMKLEFNDNFAEEILASHVFEHINPFLIFDALREWHRVLKPGGKLVMEMPNIEELCRQFISTNDKMLRYHIITSIYGAVNSRENGISEEITSPHLFGWYPEIVYDHLMGVGFKNITFLPEQLQKSNGTNFRVEATK